MKTKCFFFVFLKILYICGVNLKFIEKHSSIGTYPLVLVFGFQASLRNTYVCSFLPAG